MPHDHELVEAEGTISDIFSHRFVVESPKGKFLADIGKHNLGKIHLTAGDKVELSGEQKPSEIKINKLILNGTPLKLEAKDKDHHHKDGPHGHHKPADPQVALDTAKNEHVTVIGKPQRKPEHFEILGKNAKGELVELHIELDGRLRKSKPVKPNDEKWAKELPAA